MQKFLDTASAGLIASGLALSVAVLVALITKRKDQKVPIFGTSLGLRVGSMVLIILSLAWIGLHFGSEAAVRAYRWTKVPAVDHAKFSILVADLAGDGGIEAANVLAESLQQTVGSGVQVIRVPTGTKYYTYGDIAAHLSEQVKVTGACAKRLKADVIIWGQYSHETGQTSLSNTVQGEPCVIEGCGLVTTKQPAVFAISEVPTPGSRLQRELLSSLRQKAVLPISMERRDPTHSTCLRNPAVMKLYETKLDAFFAGNPPKLPGDDLSALLGTSAVFHLYVGQNEHDRARVERGIRELDAAIDAKPDEREEYSLTYAQALSMYAHMVEDVPSRRALIARIRTLPVEQGSHEGESYRAEAAANIEEMIFRQGGDVTDGRAARDDYQTALSPMLPDDLRAFRMLISNAELAIWICEGPGKSDADCGKVWPVLRFLRRYYGTFKSDLDAQMSLEDRRDYRRVFLLATYRTLNRDEIFAFIEEAAKDKVAMAEHWNDEGYLVFRIALAAALKRQFEGSPDPSNINGSIAEYRTVLSHCAMFTKHCAEVDEQLGDAEVLKGAVLHDSAAMKDAAVDYTKAASLYRSIGLEADALDAEAASAGLQPNQRAARHARHG